MKTSGYTGGRPLRACGTWFVAAASLIAFFTGPGTPAPAAASNIFCAASVFAFPLDPATDRIAPESATSRYAIDLSVRGKANVAASVTFIGEKNAYIVRVPTARLHGAPKRHDRFTGTMLVRFPHSTKVRYAYVDSVAVDGAAAITCPTVPGKPSVPKKWVGKQLFGAGSPRLDAALQQALPPLPCGAVYRQATIARAGRFYGGDFGLKSRTAKVMVALDSHGNLASVKLVQSSGISQIDQNLLATAESTRFRPAMFLCTPIVSQYLMVGNYSP